MALRIIGVSLLVATAITLVSIGLWNLSVSLATLIGNPHSAETLETLGCVRYTFLGIFIASYVLSFCWQIWRAMNTERTD